MTIGSKTRIATGTAGRPHPGVGTLGGRDRAALRDPDGGPPGRPRLHQSRARRRRDRLDGAHQPRPRLVEARLDADAGDWDLAVFDAESGDDVAGSAAAGPDELAQGFVAEGQELVVQACRRSGERRERRPRRRTSSRSSRSSSGSRSSACDASPLDATELMALGLDVTEHAGPGYVQIVATPDDLELLETEGYDYDVHGQRPRRAERPPARGGGGVRGRGRDLGLPSGRTTYRHLFDYSEELKSLADQNPDIVQHITLPLKTYEGRPVEGIEITTNPRREDGKPVFLNMALHHAREWPSGENAMEWAYELINGYQAGDPRVDQPRREHAHDHRPGRQPRRLQHLARGRRDPGRRAAARRGDETINILTSPYEYRRKNCRFIDDSEGGSCVQHSAGLTEAGVDLEPQLRRASGAGPARAPCPTASSTAARATSPSPRPRTSAAWSRPTRSRR